MTGHSEQRKAEIVLEMIKAREVTVLLTRPQELRLREMDRRLLAEDSEARPLHEPWDDTLNILIGACLDRALDDSEREVGLQATFDGRLIPRDKTPWKWRLKRAWRELRGA